MLASFKSEDTFTPTDALLAGHDDLMTRQITLLTGQNLARGALLGKITAGGAATAGAPTAAAGNTGNGVMTMATPATGAGVKAGTYSVVVIEAATNAGRFSVEDPDGVTVGTGTVGVAFDGVIKFTLADGTVDFVAGDRFTVAIAVAAPANNGKYVLSLAAATDGSQVPQAILAEATDATGADKVTAAYFGGVFDENGVVYGTGHTAASVREALRDLGIKLQSSIVR